MSDVVVHDDGRVQVNGRWLEPGAEVSISGERGRFRYIKLSTTSDGRVVLDFIGGRSNHEVLRSFYPDRVRTVHYKTRMR